MNNAWIYYIGAVAIWGAVLFPATIGNATMTAACNGVALHLTQNDDGELHISTLIAEPHEASE